ncbi:hypothetical protein BDR22DRAFT_676593 [Usnea florida]
MISTQVGFDPQSASLEGLAVELQLEILERLTDLPSLHAIVHASPSYHRAYVTRRKSILAKAVSRDIGPDTLSEVQAVCTALKTNKRSGSEIRGFLVWYWNLPRNPASISIESFPLPHIAMLSQIQSAVRFAVEDFCQAALSRHPLSNEKEENILPLSTNETRRITRAFYRFELFCTIFSQAEIEGDEPGLDCMDKCHLFLDIFPAWEKEEIACIREYVIDRYAQLLARYKNEVVQQSPEGAPGDSSEEDTPFEDLLLKQYKEHYMSHGLVFLLHISRASSDDQVYMLRKNRLDTHFFLTRTLEEQPYDFVYQTDVFTDWINKSPLRFAGDSEGPNAAWTWSNGDVQELFPFESQKEVLRKWGYVMWDKERLDRWGVLESSNEKYLRKSYH